MTTTALNKPTHGGDSGLTVRSSAAKVTDSTGKPTTQPIAIDFEAERTQHAAENGGQQDADIKKLRATVEFMDSLSRSALTEISAIAKLALAWLETPRGYQHLDTLAHALETIWAKADDMQHCINSEAESVGCNYVDEAQERRYAARSAHRKEFFTGPNETLASALGEAA